MTYVIYSYAFFRGKRQRSFSIAPGFLCMPLFRDLRFFHHVRKTIGRP